MRKMNPFTTTPPFTFTSPRDTRTAKGARKKLFRKVALVRVDILKDPTKEIQRSYVAVIAGYGEGARAETARYRMTMWAREARKRLHGRLFDEPTGQNIRATLVRLGYLTPGMSGAVGVL